MKTLALALALSALTAAPHTTARPVPPKPVNYSGAWRLDKARSSGLPDYYARVRSHDLRIAQHGFTLDVTVLVDIGAAAPDTMHLVYVLDGRETTTTTPVRGPRGMMQVPTTLRATVAPDRQVRITLDRAIAMNGETVHALTTEEWRLAPDGRTLTVHRVDNSPRGTVDATMVFARNER